MSVNLYAVSTKDWGYAMYVFAETPNKAKALCVNHFWDEQYIELRCSLLKKDVGGESNVIVDDTDDKDYKRVTDLGFGFSEEEE